MGPRAHVMEKESATRGKKWKENRLQLHRLQKHLTLKEAADLIGITEGYLNTLEMGRSDPSLLIAIRIAEVYDLTVYDLWVTPAAK